MNVTYHLRNGQRLIFNRHSTGNIGATVQAIADRLRGKVTFDGPAGYYEIENADVVRIEVDL